MTAQAEKISASTEAGAPGCKLCGAGTAHLLEKSGFETLKCQNCGFMFAVLPADYDAKAIYRDDAYWNGGRDYGYKDYEQEWIAAAHCHRTRLARMKRLQKPRRLLEIGCAAGFFLREARSDGWDVAGVEISELMRQHCAKVVDCPVYPSLDEVIESGQRFDCVAMFEVIEHVSNPPAFLRQVRELLVPGGLLAMSTPNFEGPDAALDPNHRLWIPPAHICYFTPRTLAGSVREAGFSIVALEGLFGSIELPMPPLVCALLAPFRRGKRLRPRGLIGNLIKRYQRRRADFLRFANYFELYARKIGA